MEYIEHNGIAVQYPRSLNQMARELAIEANKVITVPNMNVYIFKGSYHICRNGKETIRYSLDDMVP